MITITITAENFEQAKEQAKQVFGFQENKPVGLDGVVPEKELKIRTAPIPPIAQAEEPKKRTRRTKAEIEAEAASKEVEAVEETSVIDTSTLADTEEKDTYELDDCVKAAQTLLESGVPDAFGKLKTILTKYDSGKVKLLPVSTWKNFCTDVAELVRA